MGIKCPQCQNEEVVVGKIYNQIDYINPPAYFRASKLPFYSIFNTNVPLDNSFSACFFCGCIWTKGDIQKLQRISGIKKTI